VDHASPCQKDLLLVEFFLFQPLLQTPCFKEVRIAQQQLMVKPFHGSCAVFGISAYFVKIQHPEWHCTCKSLTEIQVPSVSQHFCFYQTQVA
jgi:hypothetical protein